MKLPAIGKNKLWVASVVVIIVLALMAFVPIKTGHYPANAANCYQYGGKKRLNLVAGDKTPESHSAPVGPLTELCAAPSDQEPPQYKLYVL